MSTAIPTVFINKYGSLGFKSVYVFVPTTTAHKHTYCLDFPLTFFTP